MNGDAGKKFQWSKFSPNRTEQFVIRTDDWSEMTEYILKAKALLPTENAFPDDEGNFAHTPEQVEKPKDVCPIHSESMRKFTKNGQSWFSHRLPDGTWCNGRSK